MFVQTPARCFLFLLCLLTPLAWAQALPKLTLVYVEDETQVTLTKDKGGRVDAVEGAEVTVGTTVSTKASSVELRLEPNGSVLKLAHDTVFSVRSLVGLQGVSNDFSVLSGKIRMVAAKLGGNVNYNVFTPTAQAGVRGTDFAVEADDKTGDWICVKEGLVEFAILDANGGKLKAIPIAAGEFANVKMANFAPRKASASDLADKFEGLDFFAVREADVPGHSVP